MVGITTTKKRKIAIELFIFVPILILLDEYVLMPYLGMAMLPWNWDWVLNNEY